MTEQEQSLSDIDPCPACGALPCDWVNDPHKGNPQTEQEQRPVIQADRECAVRIMADRWHARHQAEVLAGHHDDWIPVQEVAAHRLAQQPRATEAEPVAWKQAKVIAAAVVQSACETDPADHEHPDTIAISTGDLEQIIRSVVEDTLHAHPQAQPSGDVVERGIPREIADQVLAMGRVQWGATAEYTEAGHLAHVAESLRITREHFNFEDVPVAMHGLYLEGTDTVLCHTGTSPNSGANAQALTGAWNWLYDQCAALAHQRPDEPGEVDLLRKENAELRERMSHMMPIAGGNPFKQPSGGAISGGSIPLSGPISDEAFAKMEAFMLGGTPTVQEGE